MIDLHALKLRGVTADDEPILFALYAGTRAEELHTWGWVPAQQAAFLQLQFRAQRASHQANFPDADHQIVEWGDRVVGRIIVDRTASAIHLLAIALLPDYRNQGIGTHLLQSLLAEAAQTQRLVKLQVATDNRAIRLYQRLGFVQIEATEMYASMQYHPTSSNKSNSARVAINSIS